MAYIPNECSLEEYEKVIYSGDAKNRLYVKHGNTIIGTNGDNNASPFASKLTIKRRILKNGSKTITLNNFVSQEVDLILHDYKIEDLSEEVEIKIGTFIDSVNDYVYVPLGKFLIQDNPTTDKDKTTYKLRDFSVKFDFNYNGKPLIDANGGKATKIQILKDICNKAGVPCKVENFIGSDDEIGTYNNSITARTYIADLAEQAGKLATINRVGELIFVDLISDEKNEVGISSAYIENALERDINSFVVEGKSEQETRSGKNYLNDKDLDVISYYGTSTEISDGKVKVNATATFTNSTYVGIKLMDLRGFEGKELKISWKSNTNKADGKIPHYIELFYQNGQNRQVINWNAENNYKFTVINDLGDFYTLTATFFNNLSPNTINVDEYVEYFDIMVQDSDGSEEYEKYGLMPSPNYPSEIKTVSGFKNLFDINNVTIGVNSNGVSMANLLTDLSNNKQLSFKCLSTTGDFFPYQTKISNLKPKTNYKIIATSNDTFSTVYIYSDKLWGTRISTLDVNSGSVFNTGNNTSVVIGFYCTTPVAGQTYTMSDIQIIESPVLYETTPYAKNYLVNKITGKNMLKNIAQSKTQNGVTFTVNSDGTVHVSGTATANTFLRVVDGAWKLPVGMYTLSGGYFNAGSFVACQIIHADGTYNSFAVRASGWREFEFLEGDTIQFIQVRVGNGSTIDFTFKPQVENGPTFSGYEEYKESLVSYDLQGNEIVAIDDVKDEFDLASGILTKRIGKHIFDGSENWKQSGGTTEKMLVATLDVSNIIKTKKQIGLSSHFTNKVGEFAIGTFQLYVFDDNNYIKNIAFDVDITQIPDISSFKEWLSSNPVTVYYVLSEPQIIQLNKKELKTFEGINNITTYTELETNINLNYDVLKNPHIISPNIVEKFTNGEKYKVSKIIYESGVNKYEAGNSDADTLYISESNQYIKDEKQIQKIEKNLNGFEINSFKTGKILGNPTIDAYDLIKLEYDGIIYKTLSQHTLNFSGTMTSTYETTVEHEAKQSNVSNSGSASFKKYVQAKIDQVDAKFSVEVGNINDNLSDLDTSINNNADRVSNVETKINDTNTNLGDLIGRTTKLEQDSQGWSFEFNNIYEDLSALDEKTTETDKVAKEIKDYIRFENGNIILQGTDSKCSVVITKEKISFYTNGNESAFISNNELYINDNTVLRKQTIGKWEIKPDDQGNLNTRWIG